MPKTDDLEWLEGDSRDSLVVDKHGLSKLIGEPVKTIDRYMREGMPTHGERKRGATMQFRVPDCVQWLLERSGNPIEESKRRQANATARKREAEAARIEGESVPLAEAVAIIRDSYAKAQARLLLIPTRFPDVSEALELEISAAINDLAMIKVAAP